MAVRRRTLRLAAVPQLATTACDSVPGRSTLGGTPTTISRNTCCLVSRARGQLLGDVMGHAGTTSIVTLRVSPLPFDPSHAHIVGLQATTLGDRVFCCCRRTARMEQFIPATIRHGWLGSRVVSVLDSDAGAYRFKSQSRRCRLTVLGKLFTPIASLFTKQPNW